MTNKKPRLRFAPSPTGPLHIGGVRTALYNYLFAKRHGGDFILRIEDTDRKRYVAGAEDYIVEALDWCGLKFDEGPHKGGKYGPYRQSERKIQYEEYAKQLITTSHAYYAFDTAEELDAMRSRLQAAKSSTQQYNALTRGSMTNSLTLSQSEIQSRLDQGDPYVVRVKMPEDEEIFVNDLIRGDVVTHSSTLDDKIIFKSDGWPTYHLANVVDDHLMGITHVIRGEEWLPSAPLHTVLYRYLGWSDEMPQFAHLPLLLKPDGNGKLSKRDGDKLGFPVYPISWKDPDSGECSAGYRESGYFPDAFVNMLALLGWNPGTEQELFSMEELISAFSLERVGKAGSRFDFEKAKWFQQHYLMVMEDGELARQLQPVLAEEGITAEMNFVTGVCGLMRERVTFIKDIYEDGKYFFSAPAVYDKETVKKRWKDNSARSIHDLLTVFGNADPFQPDILEEAFKKYVEGKGMGMGAALGSLRLVITGKGSGPGLFDIISLLGKEQSLERMQNINISTC